MSIKTTSAGHRIGDCFISKGNMKMSFPTFSLPAVKTCPGCTKLCVKTCYARKAERAYAGVSECRKRNHKATKTDAFVESMVAMIEKSKASFFRIHESGDFYSQAYLDKWLLICRRLPHVKFLALTKSFDLFYGYVPSNLQIIWSIFPDTDRSKVPPGPRAYAGDCPDMPAKRVECPGQCDTCLACWGMGRIGLDVHFNLH